MDRKRDIQVSRRDVEEELQEKAFQALKVYTEAVAAVKDFKLDEARDEGFEAGVLASENGLGRF